MKQLIIIVTLLLFVFESKSQSKEKIIFEFTSNGETYAFSDDTFYNLDVKPTDFNLKILDDKKKSIIVDVYRILINNNNQELHYFMTEFLPKSTKVGEYFMFENSIDISNMFKYNKNRFKRTVGFRFEVCIIDYLGFKDIRDYADCQYKKDITIKYGH